MTTARRILRASISMILAGLAMAITPQPAKAEHHGTAVAKAERSYVDESRGIKATMGFAGSDTRRLDVKVWYPHGQGGPYPLVIYTHGTFGYATNAMHFVNALVEAGYVVAAADYPLTSRNAFTKVKFADISDTSEQVKDVSFIIDSLLSDPELSRLIDGEKIGTTGHSLGGVTSYFASFGIKTRDDRIKATAPIAGGDPVQTALDNDMGFAGTGHSAIPVPVLFLQADQDVFARMTGRPYAAYARVEGPKYQILLKGGYHIAFRDGDDRHPGGKNPDCLFFERNMPDMPVPGCEGPGEFMTAARQQEITRTALVTFFDAYLKGDDTAKERLQSFDDGPEDVVLVYDE